MILRAKKYDRYERPKSAVNIALILTCVLTFVYAALFNMVLANVALAKQLTFNKEEAEHSYLFSYIWLDANKKQQTLSVHLDKKPLLNKFRNFRIHKPVMAQKVINKTLKKSLQKQRFDGVRMRFHDVAGEVDVFLSGDDKEKVEAARVKVNELKADSYQHYLTEHFYTQFTFPDGNDALKPDHVRFAHESAPELKPFKPIILSKVPVKNIREVTEFTLGFMQSIPYSELSSRATSSGAGFNPPLKLLWENQGDCDSKVTLTASLLRTIMPRVKMALVFLENHALIGIKVRPKNDDITIQHNNITYVLAEPTGPALLTLGNVSESSEQAVYQGQYTVEEYHKELITPQENSTNNDALSDSETVDLDDKLLSSDENNDESNPAPQRK